MDVVSGVLADNHSLLDFLGQMHDWEAIGLLAVLSRLLKQATADHCGLGRACCYLYHGPFNPPNQHRTLPKMTGRTWK